jgi:hypothetical protein
MNEAINEEGDESPYCEKCGSCGEEGCCPLDKCKYGLTWAINELEYLIRMLEAAKELLENDARKIEPMWEYANGFQNGAIDGMSRALRLVRIHINCLKDNPKPSIVHDRP